MQAENNRDRIRGVSDHLHMLSGLLLYAIPSLTFGYWLFFNDLPYGFKKELANLPEQPLILQDTMLAFIVALLPLSVVMYGLLNVRRLLRFYSNGIIFTEGTVRCLRNLGYALMLWVLANIIFDMLISILLTYSNTLSARHIRIDIETYHLFTLAFGAVIILISWVMREGAVLEEDQSLTV